MKKIIMLLMVAISIFEINASTFDDLPIGKKPFIFINDFETFFYQILKNQDPEFHVITSEITDYIHRIISELTKEAHDIENNEDYKKLKKADKENNYAEMEKIRNNSESYKRFYKELEGLSHAIFTIIGKCKAITNEDIQKRCYLMTATDFNNINNIINNYIEKYNLKNTDKDPMTLLSIFVNFFYEFRNTIYEKREKIDNMISDLEKRITEKYPDIESLSKEEARELREGFCSDYRQYIEKEYEKLGEQNRILEYCNAIIGTMSYNDFKLSMSEALDFAFKTKKIIIDLINN